MNGVLRIAFCLWLSSTFHSSVSQEEEDYPEYEFLTPEYFQITDNRPLILNQSYCLENISATIISNNTFSNHSKSSFYIKITWSSKNFMESIKVESDSENDSYCDAENKHYYNRKPLNQSFHVFPDDVNEGIRFLPIKLDCKYIITPELEGMCRPVGLRYKTPGNYFVSVIVCCTNGNLLNRS